MIASIMHSGSGLGNQLHRYIAMRCLGLDKNYEFSVVAPDLFKGASFMDLDLGIKLNISHHVEMPAGKVVADSSMPLWEEKTNYYNPEINFIEDNTIIDGEFQDERYFGHRMNEIDQWLKVEPLDIFHDICVIGFRGGEYALFPELFLTKEYWDEAIVLMTKQFDERFKNIMGPKRVLKFEVHTDDPVLAAQFFPDYKIINDIGINWRSMRYAKYAIVANSSFYILPRLLKHHDGGKRIDLIHGGTFTIAPRFWARRNTKEWSMPANFYKSFLYV